MRRIDGIEASAYEAARDFGEGSWVCYGCECHTAEPTFDSDGRHAYCPECAETYCESSGGEPSAEPDHAARWMSEGARLSAETRAQVELQAAADVIAAGALAASFGMHAEREDSRDTEAA